MRRQRVRSECQYEDTETLVAIFDPTTYDNPNVPSNIITLKPPLHYNWHRTYDPMVGRYLEPDPLGQRADVNPYRYVGYDPINRIDPTGKVPVLIPAVSACLTNPFCRATAFAAGEWLIGKLIDSVWPAASEPEDEPEDALHPQKQCAKGRARNKLRPDPDARGAHTTWKRDPKTGEVTGHAEWDEQGNPVKRTDLAGSSHGGVEIPHTHVYGPPNVDPETGRSYPGNEIEVRPATPDEIP